MEKESKVKVSAIDGAAIDRFKTFHGMTVSDACNVLGVATPHKFGETIKKKSDDINPSLAYLVRFFSKHPEMVPKARPMEIIDAFAMFQRVLGAQVLNEATFAFLLGRTPGSGYRWIRQSGRVTPYVSRILDRFSELIRLGASEEAIVRDWVEIVREECSAKGKEFLLDREKRGPGGRPPKPIEQLSIGAVIGSD